MKKLLCFALAIGGATFSSTTPSIPEIRMTPAEVMSGDRGASQIGSSKLAGVHTKVLSGNPAAAGFYSILLFVPAHTTIPAHSHRDDRMATMVSGSKLRSGSAKCIDGLREVWNPRPPARSMLWTPWS